MTTNSPPESRRPATTIGLVAGLLGSLACMVLVGRRNQSALLMLMFAVWVSAPFVGMAFLDRRMPGTGAGHSRVILLLGAGSLAVYAYVAIGPGMRKPAAPFLIVPAVTLMVLGAVALAASRGASRNSGAERRVP
jgi:hypothetical protein